MTLFSNLDLIYWKGNQVFIMESYESPYTINIPSFFPPNDIWLFLSKYHIKDSFKVHRIWSDNDCALIRGKKNHDSPFSLVVYWCQMINRVLIEVNLIKMHKSTCERKISLLLIANINNQKIISDRAASYIVVVSYDISFYN